MTRDEALQASEFHINGECFLTVGPRGGRNEKKVIYRRNGQTRTWKRNPERFAIPVKYGLRYYGIITQENMHMFHTAENCPIPRT